MSVLFEFAMFPTDKGESVSKFVSKIIDMIDKSGVNYQLTSMGTIVETKSMDDALEIINKSYKILEPFSERIYSTVTFDIRKSKIGRIHGKIDSIKKKLNIKI
ncbi:MAG: MTH1187 family thiamine-binding protein [Candidatus Marinimicrobia bacterium]|nr:MTH1187 family thiamine-binding protein [Candidatus Neomarinimicrobiota bacterium]